LNLKSPSLNVWFVGIFKRALWLAVDAEPGADSGVRFSPFAQPNPPETIGFFQRELATHNPCCRPEQLGGFFDIMDSTLGNSAFDSDVFA
jgi:hypothetical protein